MTKAWGDVRHRFADVGSLRDRSLDSERDGRFDIHFTSRSGPLPQVNVYDSRHDEIDGVAGAVRHLVRFQKVLPNDILILYPSHWPYRDSLPAKLQATVGSGHHVHLVDRDHETNKKLPLLEEGFLTVSTIASAKGYDAPVVFLLGVDELGVETQDRATFYVGATRAKLLLVVSGVKRREPTLLDEVVATAKALAPTLSISRPSRLGESHEA